ncbi:F0F1 ATP synthase subunit A [Clostridium sp.]|uniref:F0F1 ATP synthase subunit A n=1 Tax=Clostridium sp. TaxID=1506 RepID=UPI0034642445
MGAVESLYSFDIGGLTFNITPYLVIQWVIILIIAFISLWLTRSLKEIPGKKQNVAELFVESVTKVVSENMGENFVGFVPFIGALGIYLLSMNMTGLFGVAPPTKDYSVALSVAAISFIVIQAYAIKKLGIIHYFTGYAKPFAFMLPLNIMERIMLPLSLSLRLFGNMLSATIIMELLYEALGHVSWIAQIGIPVPLHFYFDIFDGTIQMVIFVMLTMINIKLSVEH